mgnify:FL=1
MLKQLIESSNLIEAQKISPAKSLKGSGFALISFNGNQNELEECLSLFQSEKNCIKLEDEESLAFLKSVGWLQSILDKRAVHLNLPLKKCYPLVKVLKEDEPRLKWMMTPYTGKLSFLFDASSLEESHSYREKIARQLLAQEERETDFNPGVTISYPTPEYLKKVFHLNKSNGALLNSIKLDLKEKFDSKKILNPLIDLRG